MCIPIFWQFLVLGACLVGSSDQNCKPYHLQERYCNHDYVLIAELTKAEKQENIYTMSMNSLIKGNYGELNVFGEKSIHIRTEKNLKKLEELKFVVFGYGNEGIVDVGKCDGFVPWRLLSTFEKHGLNHFYKKGCVCVPEIGDYRLDLHCKWSNSYMKRRDGKCNWVQGTYLSRCENSTNSM